MRPPGSSSGKWRSCDRAGEVERAIESIRLVESLVPRPLGGRPVILATHCKLALGSVLCAAGRWSEGEAVLGPATIACMHGSSFRGDGATQLGCLADAYQALL